MPTHLRALRQQARLSLDHLAYLVGVDASTLSRAERGYRPLKTDAYERAQRACRDAIASHDAAGANATQ